MAQDEEWQLEGSTAELYERYLVPAITALWAADLVGRAAPQPGERVLDVACGTGVVARLAAKTMGAGHVVGLDINAAMLAVARSRPAGPTPHIEWLEASALEMPFPDRSFDLILCQLGLQFFPDRSRALREMLRVLVPDGRLALSVFTAIERTPNGEGVGGRPGSTLRPRRFDGQTFGAFSVRCRRPLSARDGSGVSRRSDSGGNADDQVSLGAGICPFAACGYASGRFGERHGKRAARRLGRCDRRGSDGVAQERCRRRGLCVSPGSPCPRRAEIAPARGSFRAFRAGACYSA